MATLSASLSEFKDYADQISLLKIEKYVNDLCSHNLNPEERTRLELFLGSVFGDNVLVNYFLAYIDFKIELQGSNQIKLDKNSFVVFKDRFLNILSHIDSNDIRVSLVGLLIHAASRIYFESPGRSTRKQNWSLSLSISTVRFLRSLKYGKFTSFIE